MANNADTREDLLNSLMAALKSPNSNISTQELQRLISSSQTISKTTNDASQATSSVSSSSSSSDNEETLSSASETLVDDQDKQTLSETIEILEYPRRQGADDLGRDYEIKITALLAFRYAVSKDTKDFWLGSNVDDVGDFDDIVLCQRTNDDRHITYLIQLKHQEKPKSITRSDLMRPTINKEGKTIKSKIEFSLAKYSKGFADLMDLLKNTKAKSKLIESLRRSDEILFILYTNKNVTECEFLQKYDVDLLDLLDTSTAKGSIHKFIPNKLHEYDAQFLQKLLLFSNQTHLNQSEKLLRKEVKGFFKKLGVTNVDVKSITKRFIAFVKAWTKGVVKDNKQGSTIFYTLSKSDIMTKFIEISLDPYEYNFSKHRFLYYDCSQKNIWNKMVEDKSITVIDEDDDTLEFLKQYIAVELRKHCNENKNAWSDHLSQDIQDVFVNKFSNTEETTLYDIYKHLWFYNKLPLILKVVSSQEYQNIVRVLKISNNYNRVFIIRSSETTLNKTKNIPKYFFDLYDLSNEDIVEILNQPIKFQGRPNVYLKQLIDESMYKYIKCHDIFKILLNKFDAGIEYKHPDHYLMKRSLSKVLIQHDVIGKIKNELFLIENYDFSSEGHQNVISISKENSGKNIEEMKLKKQIVHRLDFYNEENFEWKESLGSVQNIRKFHHSNIYKIAHVFDRKAIPPFNTETLWVPLEDLINKNDYGKVKIISAGPGSGKSVLMDLMIPVARTDTWVLKIALNEHNKYYRTLRSASYKAKDHINYFFEDSLNHEYCTNKELTRAIFTKLIEKRKVLLLLDGFDEISISYKNEVTALAKSIYDEGFTMWITTRPIMKSYLENTFNTFALTLKPFTSQDQAKYLKHYFGSIKPSTILDDFVRRLLIAAEYNLHSRNSKFGGIPLQTKLLADIFSKEYKESANTEKVKFNENFDLLYLYEEFMKMKIDILCEKFGTDAESTRMLFEEHQQLFSLATIFDEDKLKGLDLGRKLEEYVDNKKQEMHFLQREGVVMLIRTYNDKTKLFGEPTYKFNVNFVHRTFAEYLAAKWLSENFNNPNDKIKNVVKSIFSRRFDQMGFLFKIFDQIVTKGCSSHSAIINGRPESIKLSEVNAMDKTGRTVLHMIALYGHKHVRSKQGQITDKMVEIIEKIPDDQINDKQDIILNYNALDYALERSSLAVANKLCEKFPNFTLNVRSSTFSSFRKTEYFTSCITFKYQALFKVLLLHFAAKDTLRLKIPRDVKIESYCSIPEDAKIPNFYEYLNEFGVETISELFMFKYTDPKSSFPDYYSDLRFAVMFGSTENIEYLLAKGVDANKKDMYNNTPLHYAVKSGHLKAIRKLLSFGADINKAGDNGETVLYEAAKRGQLQVVQELLNHRAEIDKLNNNNATALHAAFYKNRLGVVELLLEKGATIDVQKTTLGTSLLHIAASKGYIDIALEIILKYPETINKQNIHGDTPLHFAASNGNTNVVKMLLSNDCDTNLTNVSKVTALHNAAVFGNNEIVNALLSHNSSMINKQNCTKQTALHMACSNLQLDTVEILLSEGADSNLIDRRGQTPLFVAIGNGSIDIVSKLVLNGADVNICDLLNGTPLLYAAKLHKTSIAKLLLKNGADINIRSQNYDNGIHCAAEIGDLEIVSDLTCRGVDVNSINIYKYTPLHVAVMQNHSNVATYLLKNGAKWDTEDSSGNTLLHIAAQSNCLAIVHHFINEIDINKQNRDGDTPLHLAAFQINADSIKALVDNQADLNIKNVLGKTALHLLIDGAWQNKDTVSLDLIENVMRVLLDKGANVNSRDNDENTPLHYANKCRSDDALLFLSYYKNLLNNFVKVVVVLLLKYSAIVNIKNKEGETALDLAIKAGYESVVILKEQLIDQPSQSETITNTTERCQKSESRQKYKNRSKKQKQKK